MPDRLIEQKGILPIVPDRIPFVHICVRDTSEGE